MTKRLNGITWDNYFMSIALLSSCRSKGILLLIVDPTTQVGAV